MLTLLIFLLILGLLVFIHELGHFLMAKRAGVRVEEFAFGFRPRLWSVKRGDTTYALNLIPLGGYVKMKGEDKETKGRDSYRNKTIGQRGLILVAGSVMNLLLGWVIMTVLFATGFSPLFPGVGTNPFIIEKPTVRIESVVPETPAAEAGLKAGDIVQKVDDEVIGNEQEFAVLLSSKKGQTVVLNLVRDGQPVEVKATPRVNPPAGQGALGVVIGSEGEVRSSIIQAPLAGLYETGRIIAASAVGFVVFVKDLIFSQQVSDEVTGLIGVGVATDRVRHLGFDYLAQLVLIVSIGLGVVNLMPILPLDGGHLVVLGYEKIAGRPLSERQLGLLASLGLAFVFLLFIVVTFKDIIRFTPIGQIFSS